MLFYSCAETSMGAEIICRFLGYLTCKFKKIGNLLLFCDIFPFFP